MTWDKIAELAILYGLPAAEAIAMKWLNKAPVTAADFSELRALAQQHAIDRAKIIILQQGLPLDSDKAKEILALISSAQAA